MSFLYEHMTNFARYIYDRRIVGPPIFELPATFPDAEKFIGAWQEIRDEALSVAADLGRVPRFHEIMPEQTAISDNDHRDWRMFILKAYGASVPKNMARCPKLAALVTETSAVLSASISFLAPNKHIPPHRGPFRAVLRFYLGLAVPRSADGTPAAVLKIAGEEYRIADGECLLWDDTYVHEVWNGGNEVRTALLLDVERQGMPLDMEVLSRLLIAAVGAGVTLRGVAKRFRPP
jgi:aspartate beta-hydroxylase